MIEEEYCPYDRNTPSQDQRSTVFDQEQKGYIDDDQEGKHSEYDKDLFVIFRIVLSLKEGLTTSAHDYKRDKNEEEETIDQELGT